MIALTIVMVIVVLMGWFVLRIALKGGAYDGGTFNIIDGFALLILLFIVAMSIWFYVGI